LAIAEARRDHDEGLPTDTIPHLIAAYGSQYRDVLDLADGRKDLKSRVAPGSPVIGAELVKAARAEMAITLSDALIRRTPVGALGYPGDEAVSRAAEIVGAERRWTEDQKRAETAAVRSFYGLPTGP
jgi:glycerol-3-phosphate dehydrogenase